MWIWIVIGFVAVLVLGILISLVGVLNLIVMIKLAKWRRCRGWQAGVGMSHADSVEQRLEQREPSVANG